MCGHRDTLPDPKSLMSPKLPGMHDGVKAVSLASVQGVRRWEQVGWTRVGRGWDIGGTWVHPCLPQASLQLPSLQVGGDSAETPKQSGTWDETCRIQWGRELPKIQVDSWGHAGTRSASSTAAHSSAGDAAPFRGHHLFSCSALFFCSDLPDNCHPQRKGHSTDAKRLERSTAGTQGRFTAAWMVLCLGQAPMLLASRGRLRSGSTNLSPHSAALG